MIDCGIDESRIAGANLLVVSAIVGQTAPMQKLARAWQKRLDDNGVDFFHAKDHWNGRAKPYHGLSNPKRGLLLKKLIGEIHKRAQSGLSVAIDVEEYKKLTTPEFRSDWGSPYTFAVQNLILLIYQDLQKRNREHEKVNILIEDGKHVDQVCEILEKARGKEDMYFNLSSLGRGGKLNNPILQAADLLAYGCCRYVSTGESPMYRQLAVTDTPRFGHLICGDELLHMIKRDLDNSAKRKRELRLSEWLKGGNDPERIMGDPAISSPLKDFEPRALATDLPS